MGRDGMGWDCPIPRGALGPSNTLHLSKELYLPQLIKKNNIDPMINQQQFQNDYNQISSRVSMSSNRSISIFIRFGIMYLIKTKTTFEQCLTLKDFVNGQNRGLFFLSN